MGLLLILGCSEKRKEENPLVARVGQKAINLAQLRTRYGLPPSEDQKDSAKYSPGLEAAARDWCTQEILIQEALKSRLDQDSLFLANLENLRQELLISLIYQRATSPYEVDSLQIRAEYENHLQEYRTGSDQVELVYLLATNRESANLARKALQEGDQLAAVLVLDQTLSGEEVGWVSATELTTEVAKTAFSLVPGGISYPQRQADGNYLILQVKQRRLEGTVKPLFEVYNEIQAKLELRHQWEAEKALRDSLWAVYRPEILIPASSTSTENK